MIFDKWEVLLGILYFWVLGDAACQTILYVEMTTVNVTSSSCVQISTSNNTKHNNMIIHNSSNHTSDSNSSNTNRETNNSS